MLLFRKLPCTFTLRTFSLAKSCHIAHIQRGGQGKLWGRSLAYPWYICPPMAPGIQRFSVTPQPPVCPNLALLHKCSAWTSVWEAINFLKPCRRGKAPPKKWYPVYAMVLSSLRSLRCFSHINGTQRPSSFSLFLCPWSLQPSSRLCGIPRNGFRGISIVYVHSSFSPVYLYTHKHSHKHTHMYIHFSIVCFTVYSWSFQNNVSNSLCP